MGTLYDDAFYATQSAASVASARRILPVIFDAVPAHSVVDVGCGCGDTTLDIAERVGPEGHVVAVDVSAPMLRRAQERVEEKGFARRVALAVADAGTHVLEPGGFDAIVSRFGDVTCQPRFPHDDHMHIRVFCTAQDIAGGCNDVAPNYPWQRALLKSAEDMVTSGAQVDIRTYASAA